MKISALNQLDTITRNISIPVATGGQTLRVTLGQLLEVLTASVVFFKGIAPSGLNLVLAPGSTISDVHIVYDPDRNKFVAAYNCTFDDEGNMTNASAYYKYWTERNLFYDDNDNIRTDCIFLAENGGMYKFNGTELISAGLTDKQAQQLRLNTPIRVSTEEEMERMIADGETVEGQLYYVPEE